ncbi:MAG: hypothetical protein K8S13_22910 [Desulfobacula sp.]|uniref:hypothetical protein n=1 Tax=Desulfobacula sp. TaxID=2593537 RepID=UPI0025C0AB49|nr:hypothetical protein [Desulfobacula sp.]MCD4722680.1 hypothetical protein [Desulfobacula sp.]
MLSNSVLLELLAKERHQAFEQEAKKMRLLKFIKANQQRKQFYSVEKFANLLISMGEHLKRKYCRKTSMDTDSSVCLSKDSCGC